MCITMGVLHLRCMNGMSFCKIILGPGRFNRISDFQILPFGRNSISQCFLPLSIFNNRCFMGSSCTYSNISKSVADSDSFNPQVHVEKVPIEIKVDRNGYFILNGQSLCSSEQPKLIGLYEKFGLSKLTLDSIEKYGVKISSDESMLFFPLVNINGNVTAVKCLTHKSNVDSLEEKSFPREVASAVFGWSLASHSQSEIVLTTNCLDAIAVNQELGVPAVAVSFEDNTFLAEILKFFEAFKKIYLWLVNSQHNWAVHKAFAEKYGKKVFLIRPSHNPSTPLSCLQSGHNLKLILSNAFPLKHEAVETFSSFKDATYAEFKDFEKCSGYKWKRYPVLNQLLKGLRKSELTVFSGQTGTGKTTFMSEYSLDLCMQGVPTLWGSFEIPNTRLIKTMLTQFSLCNLKDSPEKFDYWATKFDQIPMFFMHFTAHHSIKDVIEAMLHAVTVYSVEHIVIDNLQFMMNIEDFGSSMDHLRRQDQIFSAFRSFACQNSCHITLVMHPRKEPEFTELNITSISGTAKATQEADNILLLQTTKNRQYLQVTKNRFDGAKGCVVLEFHKDTLTFTVKKVAAARNTTRLDPL